MGTTLIGELVRHRGHVLRPDTSYVVPPGHVYGLPHVRLWCQTCDAEVWDEALGERETGYYTIRAEDVGRPVITGWGRRWSVQNFMGRILPGDVGKRVYKVSNDAGDMELLQVENDDQRQRRTGREARADLARAQRAGFDTAGWPEETS